MLSILHILHKYSLIRTIREATAIVDFFNKIIIARFRCFVRYHYAPYHCLPFFYLLRFLISLTNSIWFVFCCCYWCCSFIRSVSVFKCFFRILKASFRLRLWFDGCFWFTFRYASNLMLKCVSVFIRSHFVSLSFFAWYFFHYATKWLNFAIHPKHGLCYLWTEK